MGLVIFAYFSSFGLESSVAGRLSCFSLIIHPSSGSNWVQHVTHVSLAWSMVAKLGSRRREPLRWILTFSNPSLLLNMSWEWLVPRDISGFLTPFNVIDVLATSVSTLPPLRAVTALIRKVSSMRLHEVSLQLT